MTKKPQTTKYDVRRRRKEGIDRRRFLSAAGIASLAGVSGCLGRSDDGNGDDGNENGENGNGENGNGDDDFDFGPVDREFLPFRIGVDGFEHERDGEFEELYVEGINMGMGVPGRFPGEAAITREQYRSWFEQIGELNANAIRVYTIHPPAFYEELFRYNRDADSPLYLFHGTWVGEERLLEAGDVTEVGPEFHDELRRTVDVVHGEATLESRPGHASGEYVADVSNYLLGYIAGIEWLPEFVVETNEASENTEYEGTYIRTDDASPFERWLAEALDVVAEHAAESYDTQRPLAFVNWPTTDPIEKPYEPFEVEDMVTVDPDAVVPTEAFEAGTFGAYHVYPYYPPSMNHTPAYTEFIDHRGEKNSYAGYLDALTEVLDVPVLVAEYGVPDSRARAAEHVYGRDQGRHTEREQGEHIVDMIEDIAAADTAGGLLFTWQDEWFKRTWNLAPFSDPDRRPFWSNVQTPEQRFGLLTFDPANRVSLDGTSADWADATEHLPADEAVALDDGNDAQRTLRSLWVTHDEAYLSIRLNFESLADMDWEAMNALIAIGHTGRGNTALPLGTDAAVDPTDFIIHLAGPDDSRVRVDAYYDSFVWRFSPRAGIDVSEHQERDSGRFTPLRVAQTSGYEIPETGEEIPFRSLETGALRFGNGNPESEAYDSLADVYVATEEDAIELRIPWLLLNVADPSRRRALGDYWDGNAISFEEFDELEIGAATFSPDEDGDAADIDSETNLTHAVPGIENGRLARGTYTWEFWDEPDAIARQKQSYQFVQEAFEN